ncbi:hypothetical protein RRG08_063412 [Elysia crispata]|uniref:Uncharacterized protein n=1 Tax=Elysia crispata TaxID=231223 RepID=A0AAE1DVD7_9GAST|nr:hypothetical protein RRG08_063412 [Elysia crispata]
MDGETPNDRSHQCASTSRVRDNKVNGRRNREDETLISPKDMRTWNPRSDLVGRSSPTATDAWSGVGGARHHHESEIYWLEENLSQLTAFPAVYGSRSGLCSGREFDTAR